MPRITESSGQNVEIIQSLEDDEPYKGVLRKPKDGWFSQGSEQYGGEQRLTVDWELADGVSTVRDWISLRLGKQQNGTVAKLRQLLNALSDKPRDTKIEWFDSDTLEWSYDGKNADNKITEGLEVTFRGVSGTKQDGQPKFSIQKYASATKAKPAPKKIGKVTTNDSEPPF